MPSVTATPTRRAIRVLTLIESTTVTGPARILVEFARLAAQPAPGLPVVHVGLVTYQRGGNESALAKAAKDAGLTVFALHERRRFDTAVLRELNRAVEEFQPDILESRNVKSHFFVRLLGLHKRYPWVAWNHGYTNTDWKDRVYNRLDHWSLRAPRHVVAVCGPFADRLASAGVKRERIKVLHNFVGSFTPPSEEEVRRARTALGLRDEESVIFTAGRLSREKGHADLLAAGALLRDMDTPPFRIVIAGEGPERDALCRQAGVLGISDKVVLAGFQRNTAPYFAMARLLALPSHSEGSPNVVLEAMAAGLPIAATSVGGVPEILTDRETGLLVPAHNAEDMAAAIHELLSDPDLSARLGHAARECAQSSHTIDAYRRTLVSFYQETLASGTQATLS